MIKFPGFIDIGTQISKGSWAAVSHQAIRSGYTALIAAPLAEEVFTEKASVRLAMNEAENSAACDYAKLAMITPANIFTIDDWADDVPAALIDFSIFESSGSFAQMNLLSRIFNRWPAEKPICVKGSENHIGAAIFMAQIHRRKVHICSIATRAEIEMISEAKNSGLPVSCDVHPLSLLISAEKNSSPGVLARLGTEDDRQALWQFFSLIDCFSSAGYTSPRNNNSDSLQIMLPLLLSMRDSQMITTEDIIRRCCLNPSKIFGIPLDTSTIVEADDQINSAAYSSSQSCIRRVQLHGETVFTADSPEMNLPLHAARIKGFSA